MEVVIVEYDAAWPQRFASERDRLRPIVGADVHHIGSTAVPGLAAKPVIDLIALVDEIEPLIARLVDEAAYVHPRGLGPQSARRAWLAHPSLTQRLHHLHLTDDPVLFERHLAFRDALRADARLCERYAALKRELAERHRDDRDAYSDSKTAFISEVVGPPPAAAPPPAGPAAS